MRVFSDGFSSDLGVSRKEDIRAVGIGSITQTSTNLFVAEAHYPHKYQRFFYVFSPVSALLSVFEEAPDQGGQIALWNAPPSPEALDNDVVLLEEMLHWASKAKQGFNWYKKGRRKTELIHPIFSD